MSSSSNSQHVRLRRVALRRTRHFLTCSDCKTHFVIAPLERRLRGSLRHAPVSHAA